MSTDSAVNECMWVVFLNFINLVSTFHNVMVTSAVRQMYYDLDSHGRVSQCV